MEKLRHWTNESADAFTFRISADFIAQLEMRMESRGTKQQDLAEILGVTEGRVSQILNSPGNIKLGSMVDYARALGMKVAVLAYDDADPGNDNGPINSQVFTECWERLGMPRDLFGLAHIPIQAGYRLLAPQNFYRPQTTTYPGVISWTRVISDAQIQRPYVVRRPHAA